MIASGREALTLYKVVSYYRKVDLKNIKKGLLNDLQYYSLIRVFPKTGRTHQIRIHMKHIGHPVVSDFLYAGRKISREDRLWCPRIFLHAKTIKFRHPKTKQTVEFVSDLPADLKGALGLLSLHKDID